MAKPEEHMINAIEQAKEDVSGLLDDLYLDSMRSIYRNSDGILRASLEVHVTMGGIRGIKSECAFQKIVDSARTKKGRQG